MSQKLVPALGARETPLLGAALGALGLLPLPPPDTRLVVPRRICCRGSCWPRSAWGSSSFPVTLIATSGVPNDDAGLASGLFNTSQQIGGALGLALLDDALDEQDGRTSSPRSAASRRRPTLPTRSSAASTSRGSRARSCSPPAASSCSPSCVAATSSRWPRARSRLSSPSYGAAPARARRSTTSSRARPQPERERAGEDCRLAQRRDLDARGIRDPPLEQRAHGLEQEVAVRAEAAAEHDERHVGHRGHRHDVQCDPARDLADDLAGERVAGARGREDLARFERGREHGRVTPLACRAPRRRRTLRRRTGRRPAPSPTKAKSTSPAAPLKPRWSSPRSTSPAPMPVPIERKRKSSTPRATPCQCSPSAARFTSFSSQTRSPRRSSSVAPKRVAFQPGDARRQRDRAALRRRPRRGCRRPRR